jgi:hypothetical protein
VLVVAVVAPCSSNETKQWFGLKREGMTIPIVEFSCLRGYGVDLPFVGHTLECVHAAIFEDEPGSGGEVFQSAARENLSAAS